MKDKTCPNCGVILDVEFDICPLCKTDSKENTTNNRVSYPSNILDISERKSRIHTWELSAIIAFSACMICLIVDIVIGKGLYWSLYAITSIAGLWLFITSFMFLSKRPVMLGLSLAITTLGMLIIYDLLKLPINWFVSIGMPISLSFWVLFAIFLLLLRQLKYKGFNLLGFIFIELAAFCLMIDIFTDMHIYGKVTVDWSAITASTLIPIAGVLFFMHYRMKRGKNLGSFFHV